MSQFLIEETFLHLLVLIRDYQQKNEKFSDSSKLASWWRDYLQERRDGFYKDAIQEAQVKLVEYMRIAKVNHYLRYFSAFYGRFGDEAAGDFKSREEGDRRGDSGRDCAVCVGLFDNVSDRRKRRRSDVSRQCTSSLLMRVELLKGRLDCMLFCLGKTPLFHQAMYPISKEPWIAFVASDLTRW